MAGVKIGPILYSRRDLQRFGFNLGREVDQIVRRDALAVEGRGLGGERLRGRSLFARHVGLRQPGRSSMGQTGLPVTRSNTYMKACLVTCATALIFFPSTVMSSSIGRGGIVPIPDAVVDDLKMPDAFAGARVEAHQAFVEEIVAGAMAAVEIAGGRFDGQIDVAEFGIGAHGRPDGGVAGVFPGSVLPGFVAEFARLRDGVEGPEQLAGANVEAAHVARNVVLRRRRGAQLQRRADHDGVADDDGGRGGADDARA